MTHREYHPTSVEGCMGCKVTSLGFDGGHRLRATTDENRATITEHRDGRQDVLIRAPRISIRTIQTEER
jgi:hypothetical protein